MKVIHNKTGNAYNVITESAICCTNEYDGARLVVYVRSKTWKSILAAKAIVLVLRYIDKVFIRDYDEFQVKFERGESNDKKYNRQT